MSKFLLNLLVQISKALVYSKIQFLFEKEFFLRFRPIRPSPARAGPLHPTGRWIPTQPTRPKPRWRICQKAYSLRLCALRQRHLLSLTSLPSGACLSAPSPSPRQPTIAASPHRLRPPHVAWPPTSRCQERSSLPALIPPLNSPPLTPHQAAPSSMALSPLPPAVSPSLAPACPSLATIKGRGAHPGHHHTHPALICSLPSSQCPPHRAPPPSVVPHRCPAVSIPPPPLLQPVRLTAIPFPFFLNRDEAPCTGAPFRPFSGEPPPRRCPRSTVDQRRPRSTAPWTRSTEFSVKN
jgi:hypothetical protein